MPVKAVQVSLDRDLLDQVDADPEAQERGRSSFVRAALRHYLEAKRSRQVDAALEKAYKGEADRLVSEVEPLLSEQEWPAR